MEEGTVANFQAVVSRRIQLSFVLSMEEDLDVNSLVAAAKAPYLIVLFVVDMVGVSVVLIPVAPRELVKASTTV